MTSPTPSYPTITSLLGKRKRSNISLEEYKTTKYDQLLEECGLSDNILVALFFKHARKYRLNQRYRILLTEEIMSIIDYSSDTISNKKKNADEKAKKLPSYREDSYWKLLNVTSMFNEEMEIVNPITSIEGVGRNRYISSLNDFDFFEFLIATSTRTDPANDLRRGLHKMLLKVCSEISLNQKRKFEEIVQTKDDQIDKLSQKRRNAIVMENNYTNKSICTLIGVKVEGTDMIMANYRCLKDISNNQLVSNEESQKRRFLYDACICFPEAEMLWCIKRSNWPLQIRDMLKTNVGLTDETIVGADGVKKSLFRVPNHMSLDKVLEDLIDNFENGFIDDYNGNTQINMSTGERLKIKFPEVLPSQGNYSGFVPTRHTSLPKKTPAQIMIDEVAADPKQGRITDAYSPVNKMMKME